MKITRSLLSFGLVALVCSCAAMQASYNQALDNAVTVSNVDQAAYTQVAIDAFACTESGQLCGPDVGFGASDQLAMTLGRLGYQVFDSSQFHAWLVEPPVVVVAGGPPTGVGLSASVSAGPGGASVSIEAHDGYDDGYAESAVVVGGGGEIVFYEDLPMESRQLIMQESGIAGVATGRIRVTPPDDVTGWREVHVQIRLGDAGSGALVWQGEWRENIDENETVEQGVDKCLQHLDRALARRQPLHSQPQA